MGIGVKTMFWSPLLTSTSKLYSLYEKNWGGGTCSQWPRLLCVCTGARAVAATLIRGVIFIYSCSAC